jgi:hypothetical protein
MAGPPRPGGAAAGERRPQGAVQRLIARRGAGATAVADPSRTFMRLQKPVWDLLSDRYFRVEVEGWRRIPDEPSLLIGVHSGGALTMDAWTLVHAWYRRFGEERILHGTAHDVLMAAPGLGDYFRLGSIDPPSRQTRLRRRRRP